MNLYRRCHGKLIACFLFGKIIRFLTRPISHSYGLPESWNLDKEQAAEMEINWDEVLPLYRDKYNKLLKLEKQTGKKIDNSVAELKWRALRGPILPDSDQFTEVNCTPSERLAQKLKESGIQVIVKMVSIEPTPDKPDFPAGP
jgi:hypothetical protein